MRGTEKISDSKKVKLKTDAHTNSWQDTRENMGRSRIILGLVLALGVGLAATVKLTPALSPEMHVEMTNKLNNYSQNVWGFLGLVVCFVSLHANPTREDT